MNHNVAEERKKLVTRLFPGGVPALWCPLLTHYDGEGAIDQPRMAAHLAHLSPWVKGYLLPGSTGDGWELDEREIRRVLEIALDQAARLELHLLVGVLQTDAAKAVKVMRDTTAWIGSRTGAGGGESSLSRARVCGFTVCPPRGRELSQEQIGLALAQILEVGLPTALYQLPQVTQNEMAPEVVADLAARFANFFLLKDTSGADRVALSGRKLENLFLVRGAEGDYARWHASAGGPYQGFLLSTANCFALQLHQILDDLAARRTEPAQAMSARLTGVVTEVFRRVSELPDGNPFANANKAMDHFFAFGPRAMDAPPPRLHAGSRLPVEVIHATGEALVRHGLMPAKGYLE